jgi:P27 family predicted phage terminase small subunit
MRRGRKATPKPSLRTPEFPPSSVDAPAWLEGHALEHWNALAPMLIELGRLTAADRSALEMLCLDFEEIEQAKEQGPIERVVKHARKTEIREDPNDADAARKRYLWYLTQFGLTPRSRPRIGKPVQPTQDKLAMFVASQKQRS